MIKHFENNFPRAVAWLTKKESGYKIHIHDFRKLWRFLEVPPAVIASRLRENPSFAIIETDSASPDHYVINRL